MKHLIIAVGLFMCVSCSMDGKIGVVMKNKTSRNASTILCDSVQMISKTQAVLYLNGGKTTIFADEIRIYNLK